MANELLVGFDCETTGKDPKTAEVVQLGAVTMCPETFDMNVLYNQKAYPSSAVISLEASQVHGLYVKDLLSQPKDPYVVLAFASMLQALDDSQGWQDIVLVSYNGESYDGPLLCRYEPLLAGYNHIDVMRIVHRFPEMFGMKLKLSEVYQYYLGKPLDGAHDAIIDVVATLEILEKFMKETRKTCTEIIQEMSTGTVLTTCFFGKYAGKDFDEVPTKYLRWIKANWTDLSKDMAATLNYYL